MKNIKLNLTILALIMMFSFGLYTIHIQLNSLFAEGEEHIKWHKQMEMVTKILKNHEHNWAVQKKIDKEIEKELVYGKIKH